MISYTILRMCETLKIKHGIEFERINNHVKIDLPSGHLNIEIKDNKLLMTYLTSGYGYTRSFNNIKDLEEHIIVLNRKQLKEKNGYVIFALDI